MRVCKLQLTIIDTEGRCILNFWYFRKKYVGRLLILLCSGTVVVIDNNLISKSNVHYLSASIT